MPDYGITRALCAGICLLLSAAPALAQPAAGEQHDEAHAEGPADEDVTSLAASLGGLLNTGNTKIWQLTAGSDFQLVRGPHGFMSNVAFAYGQSDIPDNGNAEFEDTIKNLNARARYDYFFTDNDAVFVASAFRWDEFAGLDARVQGQVGYLRVFFQQPNHRFWGEVGYDLTYDNYHPDPLPNPDFDDTMAITAANPEFLDDGEDVVHSARAFLGYDNKLSETVTYLGGLEGLFNVEDTEDFRIAFDNALRASVSGNLQLELKFTLRYDNVPVPGATELDTATVASLIYNLL